MMQRQEARGSRQELALAPVRAALLRDASAEAERLLASARGAADALLEQARRDAVSKISHAREQGRMQAAQLARAELSRGRREARAIVLGAELRAQSEAEDRIRSAIAGLKDEPGYASLRDRLAELALQVAGPGATVSEHRAGGVVARAPNTLVDCSLPRLAQRAERCDGPRISELSGT